MCHYSCCHLTANGASSVPLHTPGHSHAFQLRVKLHLIPVGFLLSVFKVALSVGHTEPYLYTVLGT